LKPPSSRRLTPSSRVFYLFPKPSEIFQADILFLKRFHGLFAFLKRYNDRCGKVERLGAKTRSSGGEVCFWISGFKVFYNV